VFGEHKKLPANLIIRGVIIVIKRIVMPKLGTTVTEGILEKWFLPEGSQVVKGDPLCVVETEKTIMEIEAPANGILRQLLPAGSDKIATGNVIGFIVTEGETVIPPELLLDV
jgi:pyruvate dehydrogenase E2 component (dihydrolipoamide acetyltransferase)